MNVSAISGISGLSGVTGASTPSVTATASPNGASDFATQLSSAVNNLQQTQSTSDQLNIDAVTGNLSDIQTATIAAAQAQTSLQLASALRSQAVQGFNEIMNMSA
ncbi:flagellar hook-basal body complex protein FliE [Curtobacterium sp. MCBD17_040]|uniref:flagellar hook-basal body complex protein FliE n=1 Tax=Curtobacterium sp. MCBD17_040 TaxID=2175674 RepID=UPI000DA9F26A|nr:flagellar hook-basal body complex protein FliE [Curtobacterium sp. MCBD17_040]WIB65574.1 flagellar hook-basal body complex protein FliE [Curtobacterium sp. MCBD17_040]